jgi:hypothetical protein
VHQRKAKRERGRKEQRHLERRDSHIHTADVRTHGRTPARGSQRAAREEPHIDRQERLRAKAFKEGRRLTQH